LATAPAGAPELASSPRPAPLGEAELYARAHRAHFLDDAPAAALAAWGRYLAAYPRGAFAPDARFNRALCLLRLDRRAEAERALRPFADGAFRGYRRLEARALLDWLDVRD
jgi:TolA-binding protein